MVRVTTTVPVEWRVGDPKLGRGVQACCVTGDAKQEIEESRLFQVLRV